MEFASKVGFEVLGLSSWKVELPSNFCETAGDWMIWDTLFISDMLPGITTACQWILGVSIQYPEKIYTKFSAFLKIQPVRILKKHILK